MTSKQVRAQCTPEFKLEAVRQVQQGQSTAAVGKVLGIPKASFANSVRQAALVQLDGASSDAAQSKVTPQQMEISRLRAENARLRMERDTAKKAAAYFAQDVLRGTPGFTK